jgi:hypothetical protein
MASGPILARRLAANGPMRLGRSSHGPVSSLARRPGRGQRRTEAAARRTKAVVGGETKRWPPWAPGWCGDTILWLRGRGAYLKRPAAAAPFDGGGSYGEAALQRASVVETCTVIG